jgi:ABC-type Fe3+ transport system permease subunit
VYLSTFFDIYTLVEYSETKFMGVCKINRRFAGVVFCFIAAFLFSMRYISAAIFGSGVSSWSSDLFAQMLKYTGNSLTIASVIALIVGVIYLIFAETET